MKIALNMILNLACTCMAIGCWFSHDYARAALFGFGVLSTQNMITYLTIKEGK